MTPTIFFEMLVYAAGVIGLIAIAYMLRDLVVWALKNWPASKAKVGE